MVDAFERFDSRTVTVGLTEEAFPSPTHQDVVPQAYRILIQAPSTNSVDVYFGKTGTLADGSNGGIGVMPGQIGYSPFARDEDLIAIASSTGQKLIITYLDEKYI